MVPSPSPDTESKMVSPPDLQTIQGQDVPTSQIESSHHKKNTHPKFKELSPKIMEGVEIERDPCFTHIDKPFGFEEYTVNRWLVGVSHTLGTYLVYSYFAGITPVNWTHILFEGAWGYLGGFGITMGSHRLWTHKTYKANYALRSILAVLQVIPLQYPVFKWALEHRIHHKFTDTEADPYASSKGFWFSHWLWALYPKSPELEKLWKTMDVRDLENDPVVRWQSKYYWPLCGLLTWALPIWISWYFIGVPIFWAFCGANLRYMMSLHVSWSINSFAHMFGAKPYDKTVSGHENMIVSFLTIGEGWHNYHHAFPWDYKVAEFGYHVNITTLAIDFFAMIGWAWDMKMVTKEVLESRVKRTGDGSHWTVAVKGDDDDEGNEHTEIIDIDELRKSEEGPIWGWDDEDLNNSWRKLTTVLKPEKLKSG